MKVPAGLLHAGTTRAVSLWFKTSKKGVLIGDQSKAVGGTAASGTWTPVLYVGSGFARGWTDSPADVSHFKGSLAEAAFYDHAVTSTQVATQWNAYKQSTGTVATESIAVTDPGHATLTSTYDLSNGGRILSDTDGTGATTSYGYDTSGFLCTTTDGNGNVTTTGHNSRGDVVSRTTCQDQSASKCSTSYFGYYLNADSDTDPRNDQLLTSSDGRSAGSTDTTYRTTNTYDTNGNLLTTTLTDYTGSSDTSTDPAAQLLEQRTYDAGGRLHTITDGVGVTTTYASTSRTPTTTRATSPRGPRPTAPSPRRTPSTPPTAPRPPRPTRTASPRPPRTPSTATPAS
ncbi:hypothetical protein OG426_39600 [Streptomyces canus]|uniref:hypothetical protein n=1 Tax=Streptomyces canus TaxID=58343 RepID=UPI0038655475|nr:hypothetical protein OG426_39600 [Streptomyces canus]